MIEIIKELNIEVSKPNIFQAVVAKQYDMNTRFIKATFVDDGKKITINQSETVQVVINALRPDGVSKGFDGVINDDGTVTVPLHSWMLEQVGTVICDISVIDLDTDDNKKLTTTSFTLLVEKAAWGGDGVTTDPQYDLLIELINTCNSASEVAEEALQKSNEANAKYDACVTATEAANEAADKANDAASGVVTIEQNGKGPLRFWVGTQEEYDALVEKDANCFYLISDDQTLDNLEARDYVVDQGAITMGDNDSCRYRKWNSGHVECWVSGQRTLPVQFPCGTGSMFMTGTADKNTYILQLFPAGMFKNVDYVNVTAFAWDTVGLPHTEVVQAELNVNNRLQVQWFLYRLSSSETSTFNFTVEVIGRWK